MPLAIMWRAQASVIRFTGVMSFTMALRIMGSLKFPYLISKIIKDEKYRLATRVYSLHTSFC